MPRINLAEYFPQSSAQRTPTVSMHALDAEFEAGRNVANAAAGLAGTIADIDMKIRDARESADRRQAEIKLEAEADDFVGKLTEQKDEDFDTWEARWDKRMGETVTKLQPKTLSARGREAWGRMVEQFKVQSSVQIRNTRRAREAKVAEETWNATIKADIGRGDEDAAMRDIAEAKGLNALSESQAEHLVKEVPGLIDEQDIKQMLNREDITLTAMLEAKDKNGVEKYFKRLTPEKRSYYEGKARDMKFSVQARNAAKYNQMMAGGNYPDDDELEAAVKSQEIDQGMADSIAARRDGLIAKKNEARTKTQIYVDAMNTMASVPDGGRLTAEDRNGIEKAAIMADGNEGSLISKELEYRFGKTGSDGAPGGAGAVNRVMNYITADYNRELAIEESKIKNPFLVGLDIGAGNTLLARLPKNIPDPVLFRIRERYDGYRMAVLDFIEQENKAGRPLDLHILRKKYEEVRNLGNMGPSVTRATWGR